MGNILGLIRGNQNNAQEDFPARSPSRSLSPGPSMIKPNVPVTPSSQTFYKTVVKANWQESQKRRRLEALNTPSEGPDSDDEPEYIDGDIFEPESVSSLSEEEEGSKSDYEIWFTKIKGSRMVKFFQGDNSDVETEEMSSEPIQGSPKSKPEQSASKQ